MIERKTHHETFRNVALFLAIAGFSFALRTINANILNNSINDLGARYVLICFDILKGVFHFPHAPWIMEYDETSFCWLIAPWVLLFGRNWAVFRLFTATVTSLVPSTLFLIVTRKFNLKLGIVTALFLASAPAQLVWDRDLVMSSVAVQTILWFIALYLVSHSPPRKPYYDALAGLAIGVGMIFAHYNAIIFPTLLILVFLRNEALKQKLKGMMILTTSYLITCSPIIYDLVKNPEYLLWRQRHFHQDTVQNISIFERYLASKIQFIKSLFFGGMETLYLRAETPVINPVMAILFLAGIIYLIRRGWKDFFFVLGLPLTLYVMLGLIKTENWSGSYHIFSMPFIALAAAFGAQGIHVSITRKKQNRFSTIFFIILMIFVLSMNIWHFFWGVYRIHPRPDLLTRLQADMKTLDTVPYLFSTAISAEVQHYHMPFWVATRCYQDRISIFGWENGHWISDPDKEPIEFVHNQTNRVGIIVSSDEVDAFVERFDLRSIVETQTLAESQLVLIHCNIDVPELLQRTWTASFVPPVLPIKRDR